MHACSSISLHASNKEQGERKEEFLLLPYSLLCSALLSLSRSPLAPSCLTAGLADARKQQEKQLMMRDARGELNSRRISVATAAASASATGSGARQTGNTCVSDVCAGSDRRHTHGQASPLFSLHPRLPLSFSREERQSLTATGKSV